VLTGGRSRCKGTGAPSKLPLGKSRQREAARQDLLPSASSSSTHSTHRQQHERDCEACGYCIQCWDPEGGRPLCYLLPLTMQSRLPSRRLNCQPATYIPAHPHLICGCVWLDLSACYCQFPGAFVTFMISLRRI